MKDIVNIILDERIMTPTTYITQFYCIGFHQLGWHMEMCRTSTNCCIRYCNECQMIFYVNVATFLVALIMNKFTCIIIPTYI